MPKFFLLYQDLNDKKVRVFLRKIEGKTLDAGCGDGRFVAYADVGVDFSKGMLKRAKNRNLNKDLVCASVLYLPFKDKAFSAAFTVDVLLHIQPERRENALREVSRVANVCYNFLSENRTIIPYILKFLGNIPFKRLVWLIIPYVVVFFAFPFDRLRLLKIDVTQQTLKRLA
jgi:ubiquinone/menaquinone biosynthesis C-methylase UbiE